MVNGVDLKYLYTKCVIYYLTWICLTRGGYALHLTHRTHRTLQVVRSYTNALHLTHRTNDVTRPRLCARITCYVTVITL
jgi:hypothetical protein